MGGIRPEVQSAQSTPSLRASSLSKRLISACRSLVHWVVVCFFGSVFSTSFLKMKNPNNSKAVYIQVTVTVQSRRGGSKSSSSDPDLSMTSTSLHEQGPESDTSYQASIGVPKRLKIIFNLRSHQVGQRKK